MINLMVIHWGTVSLSISLRGGRPTSGKICAPRKIGNVRSKISGGGPK